MTKRGLDEVSTYGDGSTVSASAISINGSSSLAADHASASSSSSPPCSDPNGALSSSTTTATSYHMNGNGDVDHRTDAELDQAMVANYNALLQAHAAAQATTTGAATTTITTNVTNSSDASNPSSKKLKLENGGELKTGTGYEQQQQANANEYRVVHLRQIAPETTPQDLIAFASRFGQVVKHLFIRQKGQAFVQFADHASAAYMASVGGYGQPLLRGRAVQVQLSNHKELRTHFDNPSNPYNAASATTNGQNGNAHSYPTSGYGSYQPALDHQHLANGHLQHPHSTPSPDPSHLHSLHPLHQQALNGSNNNNNNDSLSGASSSCASASSTSPPTISILSLAAAQMAAVAGGGGGASTMTSGLPMPHVGGGGDGVSTMPSKVIRVIVEHQIYPVSLDMLHTIFSKFGQVQKIVTFVKNGVFQALIQFADVPSAIQARVALDGQVMFAGGNHLKIDYSKMSNLTVKYNNEKSRDYTLNPAIISQASSLSTPALTSSLNGQQAAAAVAAASELKAATEQQQQQGTGDSMPSAAAAAALNTLFSQQHQQQQHHQQQYAASLNPYSHLAALGQGNPFLALGPQGQPSMRGYGGGGGSSGGVLAPPGGAAATLGSLAHMNPYAAGNLFAASAAAAAAVNQHHAHSSALHQFAAVAAAATGVGVTSGAGNGGMVVMSPVLHVSNLDERVTPDALFTLFGVYGDVLRVKILFNKKDIALIQMAEMQQAYLAVAHLDRCKLYGKQLRVMSSRHQMVQMPKDGHQDSGLTKDYTNSQLHRFKRPGSKNYNNIYPPSETLHISNIPASVSEEDLKEAFAKELGKPVHKFKYFPNNHKMALVQFETVEESVQALIKMHNYKVAEFSHLRVSFSKSPV